jgi:hypothetical protein
MTIQAMIVWTSDSSLMPLDVLARFTHSASLRSPAGVYPDENRGRNDKKKRDFRFVSPAKAGVQSRVSIVSILLRTP